MKLMEVEKNFKLFYLLINSNFQLGVKVYVHKFNAHQHCFYCSFLGGNLVIIIAAVSVAVLAIASIAGRLNPSKLATLTHLLDTEV